MRPAPAVAPASAPQGGLVAATAQPPPAPAQQPMRPQDIITHDTFTLAQLQSIDANNDKTPDILQDPNAAKAFRFMQMAEQLDRLSPEVKQARLAAKGKTVAQYEQDKAINEAAIKAWKRLLDERMRSK